MHMNRLGGGMHVTGGIPMGYVKDIVGEFWVRMAVVSLRWWVFIAAIADVRVLEEGVVAGFAGLVSVVVALLDVWRGG